MLGLNWLDITIICVLLFGVFDGVSKGFIVSFFNIAGIFLSLYLSRFFMGIAADFLIKNTSIYGSLKNAFDKRMSGMDVLSTSLLKLLNVKGTSITDSVTIVFIDIACFLIIFILTTILVNIFKNVLKTKVKKTALRHVDKFLGGAIGFTVAAIFVFIFFAMIIPFTTVMSKSSTLVTAINTSKFAKYFFYFNFVIPWLQKANQSNGVFTVINGLKNIKIAK